MPVSMLSSANAIIPEFFEEKYPESIDIPATTRISIFCQKF
ncbi:hypothetical protein OMAG_000789 [Candidatus Omnitrophus magneticus]|uniref:Uncharacterized protein n=1 Tax=Candidatus Omnitrophus magneticus TaxID=1609969 RepID=A0A0F0CQ05_9BACT|nr:hypothetical protein OMAG_000789 [Candidatus Omnitrophus magneticus]